MPDRFSPIPLGERQIDQAFPLIQSIAANVSIDEWRRYARAILDRAQDEAGIMTVQAFEYIHGLFAYRVDRSLRHDRVLLVDTVAVLELFSPKLAMTALLQVMDDMAVALDCRAIQTCVPSTERMEGTARRWMMEQFQDLGHSIDSLKLGKPLADRLGGDPRPTGGSPAGRGRLVRVARAPSRL